MARLEQLCQDLGAVVALYSDHNPLWTNQTGFEGSSESTTEPILTEVQTDFTSELDHLNLKEDRSENGVKERHGVALMMTDFSPGMLCYLLSVERVWWNGSTWAQDKIRLDQSFYPLFLFLGC
jgi:hypothetical protein